MKKIGIMCSGGDAPGMNAAVRAVVRTALFRGLDIIGFRRGFKGIVDGDCIPLDAGSVSNIIHLGGTILGSARCSEWFETAGRAKGAETLKSMGVDGLVCIGGDGTSRGSHAFWEEHHLPVVVVPGTIDNDLFGTDATLGFDTAVNTALDAIDKIRDTAESHDRLFFVEVMGRHSGFIALASGLAGGAEAILVPETPTDIENLATKLKGFKVRKKNSMIVVVSEGEEEGGVIDIARKIGADLDLDFRTCILGHTQRGGSPTANDRMLASLLGSEAVGALVDGESDVLIGRIADNITFTPLEDAWTKKKPLDEHLLELLDVLAA